MAIDNCLVCATDEGVFVDLEEQPELKDNAKSCRLDKICEDSETTKICHKCAFEIKQCSAFVKKVQKASKAQNAKEDSCVLCLNTQNETYLFDLSKQKNGVNGLIQRLQDQFSDELKDKELKKQFICLPCRYCVDLLADLKTLLDEVSSKLKSVVENGIDPVDLPKTKTIIASRNTTYIQSSNLHLNTPSDTDSDTSSIMGSNKKKATKTKKSSQSLTNCGKCSKAFTSDAETYKLFKTRKTVCKQCWLSTDFSLIAAKKARRKRIDNSGSKLCSVVLQNLYQTSHENEYAIVKDKDGNTIFKVLGGETSHVEQKESDDTKVKRAKSPVATTRQRKDSEKSVDENEDAAAELSVSRLRKDSEQSEHKEEDVPAEPLETARQRNDSEKSEEEASVKSSKVTRHRKDSEQSVQESIDVKPTRSSRRRKDSEQSVQETFESKPIRSTRRRKESEQSVQEEHEAKPTRSRNRKNSEQSIQSVEIKASSRSRRKDSEKSEQEDVQIDIDVDSESGPANKRTKRSNEKTESALKAKVQNQNVSKRKRGRSSSIESTDSVRKSVRNAKKHTQALEEIIEIDDVSDTDKVEKELRRPKRIRRGNTASHDEHSDAESDKVELKKSSPMSSKEPTPERQPPSPSGKETEDSTNVVTEVQINETRSKAFESSESEEIDILKSTDEESKHDESLEKGNVSKAISDVEIESEHDVSNTSVEKEDESASKAVEDHEEPAEEINEDAQSGVRAKSVDREEPEAIEEDTREKSGEKDVVEAEENRKEDGDDDIAVPKEKSDVDDQDLSDDGKENKAVSKKRSAKKNARKSKSTAGKKSRKSKGKSLDDIAADSSDSEQATPFNTLIMTTYSCTVCEQVFDKKYDGLCHEITHAKRLKISLEKVEVLERRKSDVSDQIDEKMDVEEDTEIANEIKNDENMEKNVETEVLSNKKEDGDVEMAEVNDKESANEFDDLDKIETVNDEEPESDKATEPNESESETTSNKRGRRAARRHSSRVVEEKREKKTRGRRKTTYDNPESEPEVTTAVIEAEPDKFAEAVEETPHDMTELHERILEESASKDQQEEEVPTENQEEEENENTAEKEPETVSNDEPEVETVEHEVESESESEAAQTQNPDEGAIPEIETHDIADDSSRDEVICDSNAESRDTEPEEPDHPIVNLDDEASGDVVDVESEAKKRSEESEVEITEVEDVETDGEAVLPHEVVECEQVDLTEKDDNEDAPKVVDDDDDDNDIEEIAQEPDKTIHEDENTVDSVTEINVTAAAEPTVENDAENPKQNDDTDNTTEDEALAQESLEDLLQRKGLQVVDEFAESVSDVEDESEKEVNISSEKENTPRKKDRTDNDLEVKISDTECTEILEITNNKTTLSKKSVVGEVQITQDVDVVEEVVNDDDDVQPQNDVVEEVEVESNNGNCLNVTNNVVGQALQQRKFELETEPISDDDNEILTAPPLGQVPREARNSKDMPSLDPICEDSGDE